MMKKLIGFTAVFILTILVAGVAIELIKTEQQQHDRYFRTRSVFQYVPGNVVFDPVLGYINTPGLNTQFNNEEFNTTVRINQSGMRDDDASVINPDVLFLGDSYAFGWGVNAEENVAGVFEQLTGRKVLNMAVPGYGNVQELLFLYQLERRQTLAGKQIFLFFCANDLLDNENTSFGAFPYLKETNSGASFSSPSREGFDQWQRTTNKWMIHSSLAKHSMLAYYLINAAKNIEGKDIYKDYQTDKLRMSGTKAFMVVAENLAAMQRQYHAPVTIVYIPPRSFYTTNKPDISLKLVGEVTSKLGLRFIDLSPVLSLQDYYQLDPHWNAAGHKKAAIYIANTANRK